MPQTQIYTKKAQIHIVPEGTVDSYEAPTDGATAFLAEIGDEVISPQGDNYVPMEHRGDFLSGDENVGPLPVSCNFRVRLKGSGAAGTAPEFRQALLASGMRESVVAGASVTYYPYSFFDGATDSGPPVTANPDQSYSLSVYENGVRYAIKGGFSNMTLEASVGGGETWIRELHVQRCVRTGRGCFASDCVPLVRYDHPACVPGSDLGNELRRLVLRQGCHRSEPGPREPDPDGAGRE